MTTSPSRLSDALAKYARIETYIKSTTCPQCLKPQMSLELKETIRTGLIGIFPGQAYWHEYHFRVVCKCSLKSEWVPEKAHPQMHLYLIRKAFDRIRKKYP